MGRTQIPGDQILDANLTSADLANGSIIPSKISAVVTDDFTFPRDISTNRDLRITNNNKLIFGLSNQAFLKYNTDIGSIELSSDASGTENTLASRKGLYLYSNTESDGSGTYNPGIYLREDSGQVQITNDNVFQGTIDDVFNVLEVTWNHGVDIGDHYVMHVGRQSFGNNGNAGTLRFGYHADGTNTPATIINTLESNSELIFISGYLAQTEMARMTTNAFKIPNNHKVILGNGDDAWISYDSTIGSVLVSLDGTNAELVSNGGFGLAANASTEYEPFFGLGTDGSGRIQLYSVNFGADADRMLDTGFEQGISSGFHPAVRISKGNPAADIYLQLGYDADGSVRTGSRIRGSNLTIELNSGFITGLTDPTDPQDAATKSYVDTNSSSAPSVVTITSASYTAASDGIILADATSNAITVNLPAASGNSGLQYVIKKIDSSVNTVTVDPDGSEMIDTFTTLVITTQDESITIVCDGSNWFII
jgi:hypothetical protein